MDLLAADLKNLDKLNLHARKAVGEYCTKVMDAIGEEVRSIAVYGSATGPDFIPKRSNINLAVVVKMINQHMLQALFDTVKWGLKQMIVPPLLLTEHYIRSSLDVFPIEFAEIKDTAVIVYGDDFFSQLEFDRQDMRLECESQLKGALLRTRQAYLEIGHARKGAERVLHASVTSLIPIMRAMLRLGGVEPPRAKIEVARAVGEHFKVDSSVFIEILKDRAGDEKIGDKEAHEVLGRYIDRVEALMRKVEGI